MWGPVGTSHSERDLEAVVPVVGDVLDRLSLEVARQSFDSGTIEHRTHESGAEALSLPVGMRCQQLEVPVRLRWCVFPRGRCR